MRWLIINIKVFIIEHRYFFREYFKFHKKELKKLLELNDGKSLSIDNQKKWINKFTKLTYAIPELIEVGYEFVNSEIKILKDEKVNSTDIIAICVVKNDFIKIKKFVEYHLKIGFDKIVILDNDSTDGSVEWLTKQENVILMQTKIPYSTNRREGWINRIIAYYGDNRWYYIADSDEFIDYNLSEKMKIQDVIKYYERKKVFRARALMLDMYAMPIYYKEGNPNDFFKECVYFDYDTYYLKQNSKLELICGGPRKRVFNEAPWLTKYPLFYFRKEDIQCKSHFLFPYGRNLNSECNLILRHYKFQPGELEKYKDIAKKGNYYDGSRQYKNYVKVIENLEKLDFICDSTIKYKNSESLNKIKVYKKIIWDYGDDSGVDKKGRESNK